MIRKTGIFGGLRRQRWALSLAFGYALLLNAILGTSIEGTMAAAGMNPLAASICSAGDSHPATPGHAPADHQQACPLCGPACPMGGSAPLQTGTGLFALTAPEPVTPASAGWLPRSAIGGRSLFASDTDSQGPPAA